MHLDVELWMTHTLQADFEEFDDPFISSLVKNPLSGQVMQAAVSFAHRVGAVEVSISVSFSPFTIISNPSNVHTGQARPRDTGPFSQPN
jgi:hypothetical protein